VPGIYGGRSEYSNLIDKVDSKMGTQIVLSGLLGFFFEMELAMLLKLYFLLEKPLDGKSSPSSSARP
jgi:hypothetical protein